MNSCIFTGRLTRDPEVRSTSGGVKVAKLSIAVDRPYKNKDTGKREADFFDLEAWDKTAEFVEEYFSKGDGITVRASAKLERWEKDGEKKSKIIFRVDQAEFPLGKKNKDDDNGSSRATGGDGDSSGGSGNEADIPF